MRDSVRSYTLSDQEVSFYRTEGYLPLPRLLDDEEAAALRAEALDIMATIGMGTTKLRQTKQYLAGSHLDGLINSPSALAYAARLMEGLSTLHSPFTQ